MAVGKALGAGVPIAAALFSERVARAAAFGDHGSTYGGNLLACRAALVFLEELIDRGLMAHVAAVGAHLDGSCAPSRRASRPSATIRGAGLIWGLDLDRPALPVVEAALELGLLVNRTSDTVVRLSAALRHHRGRNGRGLRAARAGDRQGGGGTHIVTDSMILRTARPVGRAGHPPAHRRQPRGRPPAASQHRGRRPPRRTLRRRGRSTTPWSGAPSWRRSARDVAEVRSLVVDEAVPRPPHRSGTGRRRSPGAGTAGGFSTLCAFTHDPSHFVRMGFTIVPHIWVPEKIAKDCTSCSLFRRCGQYAVTLPLRAGVTMRTGAAGGASSTARGRRRRGAWRCGPSPAEAVPA